MKKTVFTLCVDEYAPEITVLTLPLLRHYADKVGARFHVITERKYPDWPVVYEKFQIYELSREMGNDWNIFFDADTVVHPDFMDVTVHLNKDQTMQNGKDISSSRWAQDEYMRRDGRNISSCNWFCVFSDWTRDIYHPLEDMTLAQAVANIFPCNEELSKGIRPDHLVDDYVVTRNIARYGLHHTTWTEQLPKLGLQFPYLWHSYMVSNTRKAEMIEELITTPMNKKCPTLIDRNGERCFGWGLTRSIPVSLTT
jgi:hypothetical protein